MSEFFPVQIDFFSHRSEPVGTFEEDMLHLGYRLTESTGKQPRLKGRLELRPEINLADYRVETVFDWVDLAFCTTGTHQARNLQAKLTKELSDRKGKGALYVYGPEGESQYQGSSFIVRIQDAAPDDLIGVCRTLRESYDVKKDVSGNRFFVVGWELAVDFYPEKPDASEASLMLWRCRLSEVLRKHLWVADEYILDHNRRPRFYHDGLEQAERVFSSTNLNTGNWKSTRLLKRLSKPEHHNKPPIDGTFYVGDPTPKPGARTTCFGYRLQDKVTDRRSKGDVHFLPLETRRSRIEIFWMVNGIPPEDPAACEGLPLFEFFMKDFGALRSQHFQFQLPTVDRCGSQANSTELAIFERSGVYGLSLYHRAKAAREMAEWKASPKGERGTKPGKLPASSGHTVSFDELERPMKDKLRGLSRRWKRAARQTDDI